jgi:hypothetical protein
MNYHELVANIPAWDFSESAEIKRLMPQVIRRAEKRVRRDLEQDAFKAFATGQTSTTSAILDLRPFNPVAVRYIRLVIDGCRVPLSMRGLEFLDAMYPDPGNKGEPAYYGETADNWAYELFPAPDKVWTWEATILQDPPQLSPTSPTNILTERFGNLLEEACMLYAARALQNWKLHEAIMPDYAAEVALANAELRRSRRDETEPRPRETTNRTGD